MTRRLALGGKMRSTWERIGTVESDSEPGVEHVISTRGGQVGCDCLSYRFKRGEKTCKHVEAYRAGALDSAAEVAIGRPPLKAVTVHGAGEKFTVRRAFDFGE